MPRCWLCNARSCDYLGSGDKARLFRVSSTLNRPAKCWYPKIRFNVSECGKGV